MQLYLDTSTPTTILKIDQHTYRAELNRNLAEHLHQFIFDQLQANGYTWQDISQITFMSGPGSFTGLRIGAAVVNTLADQLHVPLYDHHGVQHPVIIPEYGRPANITIQTA